jgi:hypothetical protein
MTLFKVVNGEQVALSPDEVAEYEARQAAAAANAGEVLKAEIVSAAHAALDSFARTRGYDNILSACTYATDTNPVFAAEGQRCVDLRGQTWATLYTMLAEVEAGQRPVPVSVEEVIALLPVPEWPT